jgi:hypothetical protein
MLKRRKFVSAAILGALIAWLLGKKKTEAPPEGSWTDLTARERERTQD